MRNSAFAALSLVVSVLLTVPAKADMTAAPDDLEFQKLLTGMGYEPTVSGQWTSIHSGDFVVNFQPSSNKKIVYISIAYDVKDDQVGKIPMKELLMFNATHQRAFGLDGANGKVSGIEITANYPAKVLSPQMLRTEIDGIVADAIEQKDIFNPTNWH